MSAETPPNPTEGPFEAGRRPGQVALVLWLVATIVAVVLLAQRGVDLRGDLQGLLPPQHRERAGEALVMVRVQPDAENPASALRAASLAIAQGLPEERVPLAPPVNAVTGWLDRNGLYLMPVDRHDALAERLSPDQVDAGVAALRARLSSPLFGVSGEQARRDPLRLRAIMMRESGMLGFVDDPEPGAPQVTGAGDLISADGRTLLVLLETERPPEDVDASVMALLADLPVGASAVGLAPREASARAISQTASGRIAIAVAAGLVMVLALSLRQVRPVLGILAALGSVLVGALVLVGPISPLGVPLLVLLAGFGCDAALRLQPISSRRWASGLVFALALAPLWLLPYPTWSHWTLVWAAAMVAVLVVMRMVLPTLVGLLGGDLQWPVRGFRLRPMPLLSLGILVGVTGVGAYCGNALRYQDPARLSAQMQSHNVAAREDILRASFFDPSMVVETPIAGEDPEDAVDATATAIGSLVSSVPSPVRRLDSPGSYVIPRATLSDRRRSLNELGLATKMQGLHDTLESQGLRASAFSEFLRGASEIDQVPDASRALEGPLGPWIRRYVVEPGADEADAREARAIVRTRLELTPEATATDLAAISIGDGAPAPLYGPRVAALEDAERFGDRLALAIVASLWIGALLVWLGTGSFALALSSGMTALASQTAVPAALFVLELPFGPHLLPALMLVGAAGIVASGRACRSIDLETPVVANGLLVTATCQIAAGLTLVASGVDPWREVGVVITIGCAVAAGLGLFVAPGMTMLLRSLVGRVRRAKPSATEKEEAA